MMAYELAEAHWMLGFTTGSAQRARRRQIPARDVERLEREIVAAKRRFGLAADVPVTRVALNIREPGQAIWITTTWDGRSHSPHGQRFLMIKAAPAVVTNTPRIIVAEN